MKDRETSKQPNTRVISITHKRLSRRPVIDTHFNTKKNHLFVFTNNCGHVRTMMSATNNNDLLKIIQRNIHKHKWFRFCPFLHMFVDVRLCIFVFFCLHLLLLVCGLILRPSDTPDECFRRRRRRRPNCHHKDHTLDEQQTTMVTWK